MAARWTERLLLVAVYAGALAPLQCYAEERSAVDLAINEMPAGYELQAYDDCGVAGRQAHVLTDDSHEYAPSVVNADAKARTVAWGWKAVRARYAVRPDTDYVLAVTYANEPYNNRVQSLWAGAVQLQAPHPLPKGLSERLLFRVPREAIHDGALELEFRLEAEVNVVVSVIELWAPLPRTNVLHIDSVFGLFGDLTGSALDMTFDPVAGATVEARDAETSGVLASAESGVDGGFRIARDKLGAAGANGVELVARHGGAEARLVLRPVDLTFSPRRYRPVPAAVSGLGGPVRSLDGSWRICPNPPDDIPDIPLSDARWKPFHVPGQWVQQGYDVPMDATVAVAREFDIPREWRGRRVFVRFEAIHGGVHYRLNGHELGTSENLFTPVEWEITDLAHFGGTNRLDLAMRVDTVSEKLSYSSGYAFHNLGGIDRAVRLYALPPAHLRSLRVRTDMDASYRNATLRLDLSVSHAGRDSAPERGARIVLRDPDGRVVVDEVSVLPHAGDAEETRHEWSAVVRDVKPWSAEQPTLYALDVELRETGRAIERVTRQVGFREIKVAGKQLLVNGRAVKLAGACHHEIDPLTGRADTARHAEGDVELLKQANLNYIRTSHYPPTVELLDAADRIGMYVEVEAPFCWVGADRDPMHLRAVLDPTSAMVDLCASHPSVLLWSLANESSMNPLFEAAGRLVRELDPTRPTTFNNPDPGRVCDIANVHYPPMPYDALLPDDPRPLLLGEYDFPVCHEQTDVRIDPGLRELWGAGHADVNTEEAKRIAAEYARGNAAPGTTPGTWTHIVHSDRVIGAAIWAGLDEPFYLPGGKHVGYAWVHGYWGLLDAWRRPKPEWWLSKLIFSPAWLPERTAPWHAGASVFRVPVENRYSFTNLRDLKFTWEFNGRSGRVPVDVPPGATGQLSIPVPRGASEGDTVAVRVEDKHGRLVNLVPITLGAARKPSVPSVGAGPCGVEEIGDTVVIAGDGFSLVLDRRTGELVPDDKRHSSALRSRPVPHLTRFDFGDFAPQAPRYEALPHVETRTMQNVSVTGDERCTTVTIEETYEGLRGTLTWRIDKTGLSDVAWDYERTGDEVQAREVGVRVLLDGACQRLAWDRWSEWGAYPEDSISRTTGVASAHRVPGAPPVDESTPPTWPWSEDETGLGTSDFRGVKLNIRHAALTAPDGSGLEVYAAADAHVRACLDPGGVWAHVLSECRISPVRVAPGDHVRGEAVLGIERRR
jgi:hypothetical protein